MAENNINALTTNFILIGLVLLGLTSVFIIIVNTEGQGEIFDNYPEIQSFNLNLSGQYAGQVVDTANTNTNLSASYNPELAISAADQSGNAMAINLQDLTTTTMNSISIFMGLIFGNLWTGLLSGIIIALVTYLFTYNFIKWIRSGQ